MRPRVPFFFENISTLVLCLFGTSVLKIRHETIKNSVKLLRSFFQKLQEQIKVCQSTRVGKIPALSRKHLHPCAISKNSQNHKKLFPSFKKYSMYQIPVTKNPSLFLSLSLPLSSSPKYLRPGTKEGASPQTRASFSSSFQHRNLRTPTVVRDRVNLAYNHKSNLLASTANKVAAVAKSAEPPSCHFRVETLDENAMTSEPSTNSANNSMRIVRDVA